MVIPTSNSFKKRTHLALCSIALVLLFTAPGCRNCGQQCGQPAYGQPYGNSGYNAAPYGFGANGANGVRNPAASVASNSATIAPPGTYSINIPGGRGVNPYANGTRVGQLPSGLINTQQPAPTPTSGPNSPANFNQREGWRTGNGADLNTQSGSATRPTTTRVASSVLDRSADRINGGVPTEASTVPQLQTNGLAALPQSNVATTRSTDYRTTSTDERRDSTRLPVTDASNMQPMSRVIQATGMPVANQQPYYQPRQPRVPQYQGTFTQPSNSAYQGSFQNSIGSYGAPVAQPQLVRSQSTATYDPYNATASDWRDRGRESKSY